LITAPGDAVVKTAASDELKGESVNVIDEPVLQGPVVSPEGNPDVVKSQSEVDDLLASLGF